MIFLKSSYQSEEAYKEIVKLFGFHHSMFRNIINIHVENIQGSCQFSQMWMPKRVHPKSRPCSVQGNVKKLPLHLRLIRSQLAC